ncbi:hypothetical protein L873DRAFT_1848633 [Choiromyces venosus 120613-1]|uniref:Diphthamide biosynthesis protein 4 n=1 Tax=Choiromyces venosus 120613-1 TaxID=1336337 RepID=A0A3N4IX87_9PEZI|nr:hypothetical protein L873DRAFT_1848633 [Choiromyces venosus 120613-1]
MSPQQPTHYEILSLPAPAPSSSSSDSALTPEALKKAYRKALLHHHPDKSPSPQTKTFFSIDQITTAFTVLSNPASRSKYDQELHRQATTTGNGRVLQTVDLDDMQYDEGKEVWWRGCRCGEERGFVVTVGDLEDGKGGMKREGGKWW